MPSAPPGYGSASSNIITAGSSGSDTFGPYVLSAADGSFKLPPADYTCAKPADQVYLLAYAGNPGYGTAVNNTAITLIAALGKCGNLSALPSVVINELSTVAAVTAAQQFIAGPAKIGASTGAKTGLVNAFSLANDLIYIGSSTAATTNVAGTGAIPTAKLNTLGDILAPCINSTGPASSACTTLFNAAPSTTGTIPTDVLTAMLNIALNPNANVATLYPIATAAAPFQPTLATQPNDFSLGITYATPTLTSPQNIVIDTNGAAWITNCPSCTSAAGADSLAAFSASGTLLTTSAVYSTNIHKPAGLAFDNAGNLWLTELATGSYPDQVLKLTAAGAVKFTFSDSTLSTPYAIAIDSSNNAWIANQNTFTIDQILAGGTRTLAPVTTSGFYYPTGIAIDSSGYIFTAGTGSNNVLKLTSAGAVSALYANGSQSRPISVSIDSSDNLFLINDQSSTITEINGATGANVNASPYTVSISNANTAAIDGFSTAWVADCQSCSVAGDADNLLHISATGANIGSSIGLMDPHVVNPTVAAIDGSGNVWTTNAGTASVTEFLGVAGPVVTPLAVAVSTTKLGTRP